MAAARQPALPTSDLSTISTRPLPDLTPLEVMMVTPLTLCLDTVLVRWAQKVLPQPLGTLTGATPPHPQ